MLSKDGQSRLFQGIDVEVGPYIPDVFMKKGRVPSLRGEKVKVTFFCDVVPRVKKAFGFRRCKYANVHWEVCIKRPQDYIRAEPGVCAEGSYLSEGMHSGIGAARALRQYFFAGEPSNRGGEGALDCRQSGLHLPAGKLGSVIREDHFEIAHQGSRVLQRRAVIYMFYKVLRATSQMPSQHVSYTISLATRCERSPIRTRNS